MIGSAATQERGTVFTTARVRGGVVVHLEFHRARLWRDATFVAPTLVVTIDTAIALAVTEAKALGEGRVRIGLTSNGPSVDTSAQARAEWTLGMPSLDVEVATDPRTGAALWAKVGDRDALASVPADALLLSPTGRVRDGTWFHIAVWNEGQWTVPPLGRGVIFGVTRAWCAQRLPFVVQDISCESLASCGGAMAMSALLGVAPLGRVGRTRIRWNASALADVHALAAAHCV